MAKTPKQPPDLATLKDVLTDFTRQRDRGAALIAAAWVDDSLEKYLRSVLGPDRKLVDRLLQPEGPLGTFSVRSHLAYALGLIEQTVFADLEIVRRVRNDFAHTRRDLRFSHSSIMDRCRQLHAVEAFKIGTGISLRSSATMFSTSCYFLSAYLLSLSERPLLGTRLDGDIYGAWVRRLTKSMILGRFKTALETSEGGHGAQPRRAAAGRRVARGAL